MFPQLLHSFHLAVTPCPTNNGPLPSLYAGLGCNGGAPQINSMGDFFIIVANVARILIALAGSLALIFLLVGAIYYVISMGDPSRIKRAREIITYAITGLIIIIASYAIVTFVVQGF